LEGLGEIVLLGRGLFSAWLASLLFNAVCRWLGAPIPWGTAVFATLLAPVFLLSTLDAYGSWHGFSAWAWKSLFMQWPAWTMFHVTASAAFFAAYGIGIAAWPRVGGALGVSIAGVLSAAFGMFYFRLLGRLAWFISGRTQD
jgi:hypothetical protein